MANIEKQHEMVKDSLFQFVNTHIADADLSVVDEIVLSYVISVLEEASQDPCLDVDGVIEMMSAYFPNFSRIDPAAVCTWIFQLESELSSLNKNEKDKDLSLKSLSLSLSDIIPESKLRARPPSISESLESSNSTSNIKRTQHLSETSDGGSTDSSGCDFFSDECDVLQEMFPESSFLEVKHCITIANGDIDRATQILLDRQETGQSLSASFTHAPKNQVIDDNELKNRIISRYSYVDKNTETKEYKPVIPKVEPKKLVRYRDNKIVSLKGERYTEVRRDEDAELKKPKKPICP